MPHQLHRRTTSRDESQMRGNARRACPDSQPAPCAWP